MALDQDRSATADAEARVDSGEHGGLDSKFLASASLPERDETEISTGPDGSPLAAQPPWRRDFPIDWPVDQFVARRDFAKFLVLTSGAFVTGQAWIAAQHLIRSRRPAPPRVRIASLSATPPGSSQVFGYPDAHDKCLLIRNADGELLAYSQACTHLSCAVVPRIEEGVLHCPCHEGYFDLKTGRNIAGPPPRPLPKIELSVEGDDIYAIGIDERTV